MDDVEPLAFVRDHHRGVLVTHRRDGRLQTSPVVAGADDEGHVIVSVTEHRAKTKNVRRHPRASICVFTDDFFGPWVQIEGEADIVEMPDAMDGLKELYRQVSGEHDDWDEFEQAMVRDDRVLLRITPDERG
jgi:PPOX class probable F420-dependent enzyme